MCPPAYGMRWAGMSGHTARAVGVWGWRWGAANSSHGGEPHEGMEGEGRSGGSWEGGLSCFCLSGCAGWETGACWTGGPPRSSKDMWTLSQKS